MVYVKDLRCEVLNIPTFSYDCKYQYLDFNHNKSIFSPNKREKRIAKIDSVKRDIILKELKKHKKSGSNVEVKSLKKAFGLTATQVISVLIDSGFHFISKGCWSSKETSNLQENTVVKFAETEEHKELVINYDGDETQSSDENPIVITTYIANEPLNLKVCKALLTYCQLKNATLHLFFKKRTLKDKIHSYEIDYLSEVFSSIRIVYHFSSDLKSKDGLLDVKASANVYHHAISPLSGVLNLANKRYLVIPHARQALEVTYNADSTKKALVVTTGCLNDLKVGSTRISAQTHFHHVTGAAIYDPSNVEYPLVLVNATSEGFNYFDRYYQPDGIVKKAKAQSMYLDDLHCALIDSEYLALLQTMIKLLCPEEVISGDIFDGISINHHEALNLGYLQNKMSLVEEIRITKEVVQSLIDCLPESSKFVWLSSNHHNFVAKFLQKADFRGLSKDDLVLVLKSMAWVVENTKNTYEGTEYADHTHYLFRDLFESGRVVTKPDQRLGIILDLHGCEYGIQAVKTRSNNKITHGHVHYASIRNGVHTVGFAGVDNPAYQSGINNAVHAFSALYTDSKRVMYVNLLK